MTTKTDRPGLYSAYIPHTPVTADTVGESMTRQEFAEECDINVLMAKYESQGVWPQPQPAAYLDLTDVPDFQESQNILIRATEAFMSLPAKVRKEFDNDPGKFVEFASDENNLDQMRAWKLAPPAPEVPPAPQTEPPATPVAAKI
ncbi:MAG: internal scaffolding protein [Microvirus sp.]|nr:MAG: internal scaffolding protein [Microvirus sp.]